MTTTEATDTATLRRAAALMRARAEAATPGPWTAGFNGESVQNLVNMRDHPATFAVVHSDEGPSPLSANTAHIASWHPGVALAVADLLDDEARIADKVGVFLAHVALAIARTYLSDE